ncbi:MULTISPECIES: TIGR03749 family integrating conjugative element protein [Pseudomonas fluorescens group]|uniref:TIGR03749 family integrating conjugative element protein n=1 Tax=Pseudomonas fluorescens group TaxID=136843 RepID=UPI0006D8CE41|nr:MULTISPECIES: TIGR03749 family integrating conjugative element protein [Pseudomonas fluorescens group]MCI0997183.1 TIGR03749 family integrating conjugative element protein [Pseudomonas corrugata]NUT69392.1 TIGR03749 family integrating conjugative element protein [Pseudomonas corrugata]
MNTQLIAASLAVILLLPSAACQAVEVMEWKRLPLAIPLLVGQERVLFVERNVRVGIPSHLGDRLRIQSAAGTVYLRANEPIEPTRLQLQDAVTGELILLDIAAETARDGQSQLEPIRITESPVDRPRTKDSSNESAAQPREPSSQTPIPVALTRYAAQNLYAPLRTVEPLHGVRRVNLPANLSMELLAPSLPISAKALAAWRLDDYWVTAIRLTNQTQAVVDLDPRLLLGDFATATFQHSFLGPKGTSVDTTVAYLTTRGHGIALSLLPTISSVDASLNLPYAEAESSLEVHHEK